MTSLSSQLQKLATPAAAQLGTDRRPASFLFDRKQAATFDRETVFKIGEQGLDELIKLDESFSAFKTSLFAESSQNLQRAIMTQEQNSKLDTEIDRFLVLLSQYFLLSPAHKALEWLLYRYDIGRFNAESLLVMGFPYHETNTFVRLLQVIDIHALKNQSKFWEWLNPFKKAATPIGRQAVINQCLTDKHAFVTFLCDQIMHVIEVLDFESVEQKCSVLLTFVAATLIGTMENESSVSDALLSKVVPFVAAGLKSSVKSYKLCAMAVVCQLATVATLAPGVLQSLLKLLLMKTKPGTVNEALTAVVVLCQRQKVDSLPAKALLKLAKKATELSVGQHLCTLATKVRMGPFFEKFWNGLLIQALKSEAAESDQCLRLLLETVDDPRLSSENAGLFFRCLLSCLENSKVFPGELKLPIRALCLKHSEEFDAVRQEWNVRQKSAVDFLIQQCEIAEHELGDISVTRDKRKRRRRNSSRHSESETAPKIDEPTAETVRDKEEAVDAFEAVKAKKKRVFEGDPFEAFQQSLAKGDMQNAAFALANIEQENFVKISATEKSKFLDLALNSLQNRHLRDDIKSCVARVPISNDMACDLLSSNSSDRKRSKKQQKSGSVQDHLNTTDSVEDNVIFDKENWEKVAFLLEAFHANRNLKASGRLTQAVFEIVEKSLELAEKSESMEESSGFNFDYATQLAISLLAKLISESEDELRSSKMGLNIDLIVRVIRSTRNRRTLQESLRLLTVATKLAQTDVLGPVMSVFTFMGCGIFRKDDSFTMDIVRQTVDALFAALNTFKEDSEFVKKLSEIYRVFASSLRDMPTHRRLSTMARLVERGGTENLWLLSGVLFEDFCATWQRSEEDRKREIMFNEFLLLLFDQFSAVEQLDGARRLLDYVTRLGIDDQKESEPSSSAQPFDRRKHSVKKLRHFRFVLLSWLSQLLSCPSLVIKLAEMSTDELNEKLSEVGERLFASAMETDDFVQKQVQNMAVDADSKYWKALAIRTDLILKKLRALLPVSVSLNLIRGLLKRDQVKLKQRALDLLNTKLLQQPTPFTRDHNLKSEMNFEVAELKVFVSILSDWLNGEMSDLDTAGLYLVQTAAYSIKLFARVFGKYEQDCFGVALNRCVTLIHARSSLNELLLGNVLLCAGELVVCLKTKAVVAVPNLVPDLIQILNDDNLQSGSELLTLSAVTCLQRIVTNLSDFLSPYMKDIILMLCSLMGRFNQFNSKDAANNTEKIPQNLGSVNHRLNQIKKQLASVENRVMYKPLRQVSVVLIDQKSASSLGAFFDLLGLHLESISEKDLNDNLSPLLDFLFSTLTLRSQIETQLGSLDDVNALEGRLLNAMVKLTLRLSEKSFRPVMFRLAEWTEKALRMDSDMTVRNRAITGFALCNRIADSLGALFSLFGAQFFAMLPAVLRRCNATKTSKKERLFKSNSEKHEYLITLAFDLAKKCTWQKFLTRERFDSLIEPIADEIENTKTGNYMDRIERTVSPCVARLAMTVNDDAAWRSLNTEILMRTRNGKWRVRKGALSVALGLYTTLGQATAPLMPDTVPFLSELLEDENENVEAECQRVIGALENVVSGGVQQFF